MNHSEAGKLGWLKAKEKLKIINSQRSKFIRQIYALNPKYCANCKKKINFEKKEDTFCSKECWIQALSNNNHKRKKNINEKCLICYKALKRNSSKYCSIKCQGIHKLNEKKNELVRKGILNVYPRTLKKVLIALLGHKCFICGGFEWMGKPILLVLDHIDGNSDNHSFDNLRVVCGNCDMQLPTYKSKNRGKGRAWRRQRYKEGRSY